MTFLPLTSPIAARASLQRKMKAALAAGQGLSGIVDAYEAMCLRPIQGIPAAQDARLFETGTYSFSLRGTERLFHFDLVRQLPHPDPEEEEYLQIHLSCLYPPSEATEAFHRVLWDFDRDPGFFDRIRSSPEFQALKDLRPARVELYLDET